MTVNGSYESHLQYLLRYFTTRGIDMSDQGKKILLNATKRVVQIGDTLNVFVGDSDSFNAVLEKTIKHGLAAGEAVTENGVRQFISREWIYPYIWDKSGNRVKANRILSTVAEGKLTREHIGTCFVNFLDND